MAASNRLVGKTTQGIDETVRYDFDFKRFVDTHGDPVSVVSCTLYNRSLKKFENTKLSDSFSLVGTKAYSQLLSDLDLYLYSLSIAVLFTDDMVLSGFLLIQGEH